MKPQFNLKRGSPLVDVQEETKRTFATLGSDCVSKLLASRTISAAGTIVAHGLRGTPEGWQVYSQKDPGTVTEYQSPDDQFLYLIGSVDIRCGIKVF